MKRVEELNEAEIDTLVASIEKIKHIVHGDVVMALRGPLNREPPYRWSPSREWSIAGPIIERECIELHGWRMQDGNKWQAAIDDSNENGDCKTFNASGKTATIAAMRCLIVSRLGNTVEI